MGRTTQIPWPTVSRRSTTDASLIAWPEPRRAGLPCDGDWYHSDVSSLPLRRFRVKATHTDAAQDPLSGQCSWTRISSGLRVSR